MDTRSILDIFSWVTTLSVYISHPFEQAKLSK